MTTLLAAMALFAAPAPEAPLPREPAAVARTLTATTADLHAAIDVWQAGPRPAGPTPSRVTLWALHQQRLFLKLT
jgi:hypothetical protein